MDVAHDPLNHALELRARHVRLKARRLPRGRRWLGVRHGAVERLAQLGDRLCGVRIATIDRRVRVLHPGVHLDVHKDRDGVLEVVEDHEHIGEHQRHVRQPNRVGLGPTRAARGAPSGSTVRTRS